jgi:hypothetical protein
VRPGSGGGWVKFRIVVHDEDRRFWVEAFGDDAKVAEFRWEGGEFKFDGEQYVLQGPYHGYRDYQIFKMVPVDVEVLSVK